MTPLSVWQRIERAYCNGIVEEKGLSQVQSDRGGVPDASAVRWARATLLLAIVLFAASCGKREQEPRGLSHNQSATPIAGSDLVTLLGQSQVQEPASTVDAPLPQSVTVSRLDPQWPTLTFLVGEISLRRNEIESARSAFRDLTTWGVSERGVGPYQDGMGGSGLATVALWRWLQILDHHGGTDTEVQEAIRLGAATQKTRLFAGMTGSGLLPALVTIEEDIARLLAHVAFRAKRPETESLFLDFLSVDSTGDLDATDQQLRAQLLDGGYATPERLELFQYRRQLSRVRLEKHKIAAAERLRQLWKNQYAPAHVRADAAYEWSNYYRLSAKHKRDVIAGLTSAIELAAGGGEVAEKALYLRGMVQNSVSPRNPQRFFADLNELLIRFPNGRLADNALYQLAAEYLFGVSPDPKRALDLFAKLRERTDSNDFLDSAYAIPAMALIERGSAVDLKEADRLLQQYIENFPQGPFRLRSLFWRGRAAERSGNAAAAQTSFEQVILEAPYSYYGIRARLHREYGDRAKSMVLPPTDSATYATLSEAYRASAPDRTLSGRSPYHERLRVAAESGLYQRAYVEFAGIGKRFRNRLDNVPLKTLNDGGLVAPVALLLSLRQDARAARDSDPSADNRLQLAALLGPVIGDWPVALSMIALSNDGPYRRIGELQNDKRFLATAYPPSNLLEWLREPITAAAWPIDGSLSTMENAMYAIVRNESAYFAGAISAVGALGLFQITPATFNGRKDCWADYTPGDQSSPQAYLFDPGRNTRFWSCWVKREFMPTTRGEIASMLIQHQAGTGRHEDWRRNWRDRGIESDVELQIDTLRFPATQLFVRQTLADIAIAESGGVF